MPLNWNRLLVVAIAKLLPDVAAYKLSHSFKEFLKK
jgi:hypothetical protein